MLSAFHIVQDVVLRDGKTGQTTTLKQLFDKLDLLPENLTVESMGVSGGSHMFHRFDHFNNAYSPFGYSDMRTVFSKVSNSQNGKVFQCESVSDTEPNELKRTCLTPNSLCSCFCV